MKIKDYVLVFVVLIVVLIIVSVRVFFARYPHKEKNLLSDFPVLKQPDGISCGPTSATMVLNYLGKKATIEELKKKAKTTWYKSGEGEIGMTAPDVLAQAIREYVPAKLKTGNLDQIKYSIDHKQPVVVLLRSGKLTWHYVVVIGYTQDDITIADPAGYIHTKKNDIFLSAWNFSTDMSGNEVAELCPICGGDGKIGMVSCEVCNEGRVDLILMTFLLTEIKSYTMIIVN